MSLRRLKELFPPLGKARVSKGVSTSEEGGRREGERERDGNEDKRERDSKLFKAVGSHHTDCLINVYL